MTPIERAAKALWDLAPLTEGETGYQMPIPWDRAGPGIQEDLLTEARAVIAAIREPSDAQIEDGAAKFRGIGLQTREAVDEAWRAMIDALLEEGE